MNPAPSPVNRPIRAMLIDDHTIFRSALRMLIESKPGFEVVGEANNYLDAIAVASRTQPNIILLDILMGSESGLDYIVGLRAASRESRILILTGVIDHQTHYRAIQMGAMGLVLKSKPPDELIKAMEKVHAGEAWIDRVTMGNVLVAMTHPEKSNGHYMEEVKIDRLTKRERDIINLVAQGLKNKQVAARLGISDVTVRHHLTTIFNKLDVADRFELIIYAYKNHLCKSMSQDFPTD